MISGETNCVVWVIKAPATPAMVAEIPNTRVKLVPTGAPSMSMRRGLSRTPIKAKPQDELTRARTPKNNTNTTSKV